MREQRLTFRGDPIPASLYKYQSLNIKTLQNLHRRQLWFSKPVAFNDPLDCALAFEIREPALEKLLAIAES
jgi:hypothetical protein